MFEFREDGQVCHKGMLFLPVLSIDWIVFFPTLQKESGKLTLCSVHQYNFAMRSGSNSYFPFFVYIA